MLRVRKHHLFLMLASGISASCGMKATTNATVTPAQTGCNRDLHSGDCMKQVYALSGAWASECEKTGIAPLSSTQSQLNFNDDGTFEKTTYNYIGSGDCSEGQEFSHEVSYGTFIQESSRDGSATLREWTETKRTLTAVSKNAIEQFTKDHVCNQLDWSVSKTNHCDFLKPDGSESISYELNKNRLTLKHCTSTTNQLICSTEYRTRK